MPTQTQTKIKTSTKVALITLALSGIALAGVLFLNEDPAANDPELAALTLEKGATCTENDLGNSPLVKGAVKYKQLNATRSKKDACSQDGKQLKEFYCENGKLKDQTYTCDCANNKCNTTTFQCSKDEECQDNDPFTEDSCDLAKKKCQNKKISQYVYLESLLDKQNDDFVLNTLQFGDLKEEASLNDFFNHSSEGVRAEFYNSEGRLLDIFRFDPEASYLRKYRNIAGGIIDEDFYHWKLPYNPKYTHFAIYSADQSVSLLRRLEKKQRGVGLKLGFEVTTEDIPLPPSEKILNPINCDDWNPSGDCPLPKNEDVVIKDGTIINSTRGEFTDDYLKKLAQKVFSYYGKGISEIINDQSIEFLGSYGQLVESYCKYGDKQEECKIKELLLYNEGVVTGGFTILSDKLDTGKIYILVDKDIVDCNFLTSILAHEMAHRLESKRPLLERNWQKIAGDVYGLKSIDGRLNWLAGCKDLNSANQGCVRSYGCVNYAEDISTHIEKILSDTLQSILSSSENKYSQKLGLLRDYGFITPGQYAAIRNCYCVDSDKSAQLKDDCDKIVDLCGNNLAKSGQVNFGSKTFQDKCEEGTNNLIEQGCRNGKNFESDVPYHCENGCKDGACIECSIQGNKLHTLKRKETYNDAGDCQWVYEDLYKEQCRDNKTLRTYTSCTEYKDETCPWKCVQDADGSHAQCLSCTDPSNPYNSETCSPVGAIKCGAAGSIPYQTCKDRNSDGCYEWGEVENCIGTKRCYPGEGCIDLHTYCTGKCPDDPNHQTGSWCSGSYRVVPYWKGSGNGAEYCGDNDGIPSDLDCFLRKDYCINGCNNNGTTWPKYENCF